MVALTGKHMFVVCPRVVAMATSYWLGMFWRSKKVVARIIVSVSLENTIPERGRGFWVVEIVAFRADRVHLEGPITVRSLLMTIPGSLREIKLCLVEIRGEVREAVEVDIWMIQGF